MSKQIFSAVSLTGGVSGSLDDILHTALENGNTAIVIDSANDITYTYKYDTSEAGAESSPDIIIPDSNTSGTGAWVLVDTNSANLTSRGTLTVAGAATAASLRLGGVGATITEFSTDGTLAGNSDTAVPTEKAVQTAITAAASITADTLKGFLVRPTFTYKDIDEIYIGPGRYHHQTGNPSYAEQIVYWNSTLTYQATGLSPSTWYYLYLYDSAISSLGSPEITASEFIHYSTPPTFNESRGGLYYINNRFIFAFKTDGSGNIERFWNDGGSYVQYDTDINVISNGALTTSFVSKNVTAGVPVISTIKAQFSFYVDAGVVASTAANVSARTFGSSSSSGTIVNRFLYITGAHYYNPISSCPLMVINDSGVMKIDIKSSIGIASQFYAYINGYYLPRGA